MTAEQTSNVEPGAPSPIASLPNLRDLGDWPTADGRRVKAGRVYRTADFSALTDSDARRFESLGVRTVYDLRSASERAATPDPEFDGVVNLPLDVLADSSTAIPANLRHFLDNPAMAAKVNAELSGGQAVAAITGTYRSIVDLPSAHTAYRRFFQGLAGQDAAPVAFHCTTGKDRTGWAAAVLLTILGVSREDVFTDYLLTNERLVPALKPVFDAFAAAGGDPDLLLPILGVREEYLVAAFDEVDTRFGSLERYFADGLGLDESVTDTLRATFLE
ncbi:tyrosine-protein phosphatase [Gordonia sp. HY002]|uniref:tyrosine-protein phosphatase n=1 Tax=Gordonia zhenghanii TaxID=2911516 RepID=UPI001EF1088F|nr:tyrosine-protein phosphatase [Gordonia zhenghanii]MCF8569070.1 tyrosine-protein phosphatase [Gordonia zhenghanii]MCF8605220.1 tyrosine-protein phosphatase [Gordonia zhenghanii]